ncbi:hypothetical protein [Hoeflea alexandrii]|uniref:hypothetical protein n=1 Tax=Hoeflea alexandrii TaxID=288436 RepID=UPI0022AF1C9F|nr:hypothetical protein [Hoeflea alexandrii]MCZ4291311.1 hypothetical protein [Hoeflea alexandrii]
MTQAGRPAFRIAALFMAVFGADVVAGAFFRAAFLSDVMQAVMLAISCSFFVAGILLLERQAGRDDSTAMHREEETR